MRTEKTESRFAWFVGGAIAGLAVAMYWPHEPAYAQAVDSGDKFAMCTVATQTGNADAIFILDFVTGRLVGFAYNSQRGVFSQAYGRNIAADFNIDAGTDAQYVIVPGFVNARGGAGPSCARGCVRGRDDNRHGGAVRLFVPEYDRCPSGAATDSHGERQLPSSLVGRAVACADSRRQTSARALLATRANTSTSASSPSRLNLRRSLLASMCRWRHLIST